MDDLSMELRVLAERVAGGPVHVDVTWVVSAERGTTITASSSTQEAALAAFIAGVLEERADAEGEKGVTNAPATAVADALVVEEVRAAHAASKSAGDDATRRLVGAADAAEIVRLSKEGRGPSEIAQLTGWSKAVVSRIRNEHGLVRR